MKRFQRFLLSVFTAVLLSLAWLGFPGWTLFFAFIPLLFLENFFTEHKLEYNSVSFWGHAFLSVLIWNVLTTWWIMHATLIGALLAILTNSFLMSLTLWLAHIARRNFRNNLGYIAFVVFWISFEFFHFHWDIEWPWLTLGNGFANNVKLIQWYEFTGTLGGSLWILIVNIILFDIIRSLLKQYSYGKLVLPLVVVFILIMFPVIYSVNHYNSYTEKKDPRNIVIVQPNVDPYSESYSQEAENEKVRKFIQLARSKTDNETDFIVGPETVVENYFNWNEDRITSAPQYLALKKFVDSYPGVEMVIGISSSKFYPSKNLASKTAQERNGYIYDVYNSAIFINRSNQPQIYHKSILVPGVEKIPFLKYLGFLNDIFIDLGGAGGNLGKQEEASVFISKDGTKLAPVICYESVFGEYISDYIKKGAGLIFIITNDGWWKNTPGYRQHESFARLRAIETRRSIARAANTGISCFISQRGDVKQSTKWWKEDVIKSSLNVNDKLTFYVRFGDYIARISLFISVLLVLYLISSRLQKDKKNPH